MIRTTGKLAAGAACGALFALGVAPAAQADPEAPSGQYAFSAQRGPSQRTATWTFTPCGPTCVSVDGERWLQNGQFHLNGGRWEYNGQGTMDCPVTHAPLPVSRTASFDAVTSPASGPPSRSSSAVEGRPAGWSGSGSSS
ncbi:hypothetical protein [[Mycobacterium] nativiensis]|uniref:Secreted protein n=1 Tax=[Mycobacterium] nativiensis TaxID=2855503 RepID=A0ABU5Y2V8_9MYCO|nr:hypothetical protein [Mycolicibacter sp. MYC340]MEB3034569.1 hypothetical protein [Mycolicibacter sp. MYC340]